MNEYPQWFFPDPDDGSNVANSAQDSEQRANDADLWPEWLPIEWIVATFVLLFSTIVHDWNAWCEEHEGQGRFEHSNLASVVEESFHIAVVYEDAECIWILVQKGVCIPLFSKFAHGLVVGKHIFNGVIHRIIKNATEVVLVWCHVCRVVAGNFSNLEYAS